MHEMTAIVVDDEPLARMHLRRQLQAQGVLVVGDTDSGAKAVELTEALKPDLLFVDIQMPEISGMNVADTLLQMSSPTLVIFVTGYSEHALSAFDREAFDYLVKPVSKTRLAQTLGRARGRLLDSITRAAARSMSDKHLDLVEKPSQADTPPRLERLPIRDDYKVRFVRVEDIVCAEASDKRVTIHTSDAVFRTKYTLKYLEDALPQDRFLRVHESYIVNIGTIEELLFLGNHVYELRLSDNRRVPVGRSRYGNLQKRLGFEFHDVR
ncbi:MAG: LytR/AlgR family response regulator transcription factor [Capsulimonadaceae bacterium]